MGLHVEIDAALAYEFILSLGVAVDVPGRKTYEGGVSLLEGLRKAAAAKLLRQIHEFSGESDLVWVHLLSFVYDAPPPRTVPAFLEYLAGADPDDVRLRMLGYYVRYFRRATPPDIIMAAAQGDRDAQRQFLATSYPANASWQAALRALLPLTSGETRDRLLEILRQWYEVVFRSYEDRVMHILQRDADAKLALANERSPQEVVEAALAGMEFVPEPGLRRVLLIPSSIIRPVIHSFDHRDTKIFVYPVSEESVLADARAPSARLVRLTKALGDERRLRILRELVDGNRTLGELAERFGVGNTTMLHHLVVLRGAGLVRQRTGGRKEYSIARDAVAQLQDLLGSYLGEEPT